MKDGAEPMQKTPPCPSALEEFQIPCQEARELFLPIEPDSGKAVRLADHSDRYEAKQNKSQEPHVGKMKSYEKHFCEICNL